MCLACIADTSIARYCKANPDTLGCEAHPNSYSDYSATAATVYPQIDSSYGDEVRFSTPTYHAWGGGLECSQTALMHVHHQDYIRWVGDVLNSDGSGKWEQMRRCNSHSCPIDCVVSSWGEASTCVNATGPVRQVLTCGSGDAMQRRVVNTPAEFGGKACPTLEKSTPCNSHACENAKCHISHVKCSIAYMSYAAAGAACPDPAGCHTCSDALECKAKKLVRLLQVTHDKEYSHVGGNFKCDAQAAGFSTTGPKDALGRHGSCECKCSQHPLACFKKNQVLQNAMIGGNAYQNIEDLKACSNLCSHHPLCTSWQYDSAKKCILHSGAAQYAANPDIQTMTTWAGLTTSGNQCLAPKPLHCAMNHYLTVDPATDLELCLECPTEHYSNASSVGLAACKTYSSNGHHSAVFNYQPVPGHPHIA